MIKIYSTSWKSSDRQKLLQFFDENDISYVEYDLNSDIEVSCFFEKAKLKVFPVTEIGETRIHGFDRNKIRTALKQHGIKI